MAKKLCLFLLVCLTLSLSCRYQEKWHTTTLLYFDTVCEVRIFCSGAAFKSALKEVHRIFTEIESHFSPGSDDYSSAIVFNLFQRALQVYHDSDGYFDITVGPLSRAWGFLTNSRHMPTPGEIKSILKLIGMEKIREEEETLILLPGMELDWGSIAKGFGIDLASQSLMEMEISRGFINAGGDLYCWGENPDNRSWQIAINHPRKSGYLGILSISDLGAATTGDYQRYFIQGGVRYSHVLNPHTGYPAQGKQSVTVCGPETLLCDALSTALFISTQPEKILEKYPDYGAIIADSNGKLSFIGKPYPFK